MKWDTNVLQFIFVHYIKIDISNGGTTDFTYLVNFVRKMGWINRDTTFQYVTNAMYSSLKLLDGCNGIINLKADWTIYYACNVTFLSWDYKRILYN